MEKRIFKAGDSPIYFFCFEVVDDCICRIPSKLVNYNFEKEEGKELID